MLCQIVWNYNFVFISIVVVVVVYCYCYSFFKFSIWAEIIFCTISMWYFANEITRFCSFWKFPSNIITCIQLKEWYLLLQMRIRKPTCIRNIYVHECILSLSSALFIALFKHTSVFHIQPRLFILGLVKRTHQKKFLWFSIFHLAFGRHIVRWIRFLETLSVVACATATLSWMRVAVVPVIICQTLLLIYVGHVHSYPCASCIYKNIVGKKNMMKFEAMKCTKKKHPTT